jgi:tetratricopeptide (TPR) repeat protein
MRVSLVETTGARVFVIMSTIKSRPARLALGFAAAAIFLLAGFGSLQAGASRMLSEYGRTAGLIEPVLSATQLTPRDPYAHESVGLLLTNAGRLAEAGAELQQAAILSPHNVDLQTALGSAYEGMGDLQGALAAYSEGVRLAPFYPQPKWRLGNALLRSGRMSEAFDNLRSAARADPSLFPNLLNLAWFGSGRNPEVLQDLVQPQTDLERVLVSKYLAAQGEPDAAVRVFRSAGSLVSTADRSAMIRELIANGAFAQAYQIWSADPNAIEIGRMVDPGFEEARGIEEAGFGWTFSRETAGETIAFSIDQTRPLSGKRSLKVDLAGNSNPSVQLVSQLVLVEVGNRYRLSFAVRTEDLVTGGLPVIRVSEAKARGESTSIAQSQPFSSKTSTIQTFTIDFTAPSSGAVLVILERIPCSSTPCPAYGQLWLDDFNLSRL